MEQIIIQGIGFIALTFILLSFQKNKKSAILILLVAASTLFAIHYTLLAAWTAVAMNVIAALRSFIFNFRETKKWADHILWMYFFILLYWIGGFLTWQGYISLLPASALTLESFALWNKKTKHIRALFITGRPLWFIYNFIVGSYAGMLAEILIFSSVFIGILRFDYRKRK